MMTVNESSKLTSQEAGRASMGGSGAAMQMDSFSKNIQAQIARAQKELQELSSNETMPLEEKMKKRQAIQQEITSLSQQLRQHQMEQRKAKQSKGSSMEDMLGGSPKKAGSAKPGSPGKGNGLSQASMQAMISAGSSMKQAQAQGSVATKIEGQSSVLAGEIRQDAERGVDTEKKEADLADLGEKAQAAKESQAAMLADGSQAMEEAAKADQEAEKSEGKKEKGGKKEPAGSGAEIEAGFKASNSGQSPAPSVSVDILL